MSCWFGPVTGWPGQLHTSSRCSTRWHVSKSNSSASASRSIPEGALGKAVLVIVRAIAELERSLIKERVRAGLRRARLEGRRIGRPKLAIDRDAVLRDRADGMSLNQLAKNSRSVKAPSINC